MASRFLKEHVSEYSEISVLFDFIADLLIFCYYFLCPHTCEEKTLYSRYQQIGNEFLLLSHCALYYWIAGLLEILDSAGLTLVIALPHDPFDLGPSKLFDLHIAILFLVLWVPADHYSIGIYAVRLRIVPDASCGSCKGEHEVETFLHFLLRCPAFSIARRKNLRAHTFRYPAELVRK